MPVFWLLQYTHRRCFESFVQNAVDARREADQNTESTVVTNTMKLIGNSSSGYQIMDCSRHTKTIYVKVSHMDKFYDNRFLKPLNELPGQIYAVEMDKTRIELNETTIVGFCYPPRNNNCWLLLTPNLRCCNSIKISPLSVIWTNMTWLNRILIVFKWYLVRKNSTTWVDQKYDYCDTGWCKAVAVITLQKSPAAIYPTRKLQ